MQTAKVEALGDETSRVTVIRSLDGESAEGEVIVPSRAASAPGGTPHVALAEARAFLALGEKLLARQRLEGAVQAVKSGVSALGTDYRPDDVRDDTGLNLLLAQHLIEQGQREDGAEMMLSMLNTRIELYVDRHEQDMVR